MTWVKEEIINELNDPLPRTYGEALDFIWILKSLRREATLVNEPALRKS